MNGKTLAARQSYELRDGSDISFAVRDANGENLAPVKMRIAIDLGSPSSESGASSDAESEKAADVKAV